VSGCCAAGQTTKIDGLPHGTLLKARLQLRPAVSGVLRRAFTRRAARAGIGRAMREAKTSWREAV